MNSRTVFPSLLPTLLAGLALTAGQLTLAQTAPPAPAPPRPLVTIADNSELALQMLTAANGRGYLGVGITDLNKALCEHFGVDQDGAVLLSGIEEDSPAEAAGLRVGDILSAVDGTAVLGSWSLRSQIAAHEKDDRIVLELWRDGSRIEVEATLDERKITRIDLGNLRFPKGLFARDMRALPTLPALPALPDLSQLGDRYTDAMKHYAEAMELMQEKLNDEDFLKQLQTVTEEREQELEKRLEELEVRLQELDRRLEKRTK